MENGVKNDKVKVKTMNWAWKFQKLKFYQFFMKFSKLRLKLYFSISSRHSTLAWNCPSQPLLRSWISWIFCLKFWESKILIDELSDVLERFDFYLWERLSFEVVAFWIKLKYPVGNQDNYPVWVSRKRTNTFPDLYRFYLP